MLMHDSDPIYVRASIHNKCNLTCMYCPKSSGMENHVPPSLRGQLLPTEQYVVALRHLARHGINGISFTGGEPTLNVALPQLVSEARTIFSRVELTTNGLNLSRYLGELAKHLDLIKVSLDSLDPNLVARITGSTISEAKRAQNAIEASAEAGLRVGINVVAMKSTIPGLEKIFDYARNLNSRYSDNKVYVSILDFYYSQERKAIWEDQFLPLETLEGNLTDRYGPPTLHMRFGCRFLWFDGDGVQIRLKDSYGATQRAEKCRNCVRYCQEGIYGLKLSAEGWVTTCPTGDPDYGVQLKNSMTNSEADDALAGLLKDLTSAQPDPSSFSKMLATHSLRPLIKSESI